MRTQTPSISEEEADEGEEEAFPSDTLHIFFHLFMTTTISGKQLWEVLNFNFSLEEASYQIPIPIPW
jgi:hypothetical protein